MILVAGALDCCPSLVVLRNGGEREYLRGACVPLCVCVCVWLGGGGDVMISFTAQCMYSPNSQCPRGTRTVPGIREVLWPIPSRRVMSS